MICNFSSKAQEISYALMRVAVYIKRSNLRSRLEGLALEIIEGVAGDCSDNVLSSLNRVKELLRLGVSIYEIETLNAQLIIEQIEALAKVIGHSNQLEGNMPAVKDIFSKPLEVNMRQSDIRQFFNNAAINTDIKRDEELPNSSIAARDLNEEIESANHLGVIQKSLGSDQASSEQEHRVLVQESGGMVSIASTIRQTAIFNKVKMMTIRNEDGSLLGCRMKDLMATFPEVSERTLRNDLQRLLGQGRVDRIGNGGPASFYVIKQGR